MPSKYQTSFERTVEPDPEVLIADLGIVKKHARIPVEYTGQDDLLTQYILAAEAMLELQAEIMFRPQKWLMTFARLPEICDSKVWWNRHRFIRIEMRGATGIDSIDYYDSDNQLVTWDAINYSLTAGRPQNLTILNTVSVPSSFDRPDAWKILISGGSDVIPPQAKMFIEIMAAYWYRNPEDMGKMPSDTASRRTCDNLIDSLRWRVYP